MILKKVRMNEPDMGAVRERDRRRWARDASTAFPLKIKHSFYCFITLFNILTRVAHTRIAFSSLLHFKLHCILACLSFRANEIVENIKVCVSRILPIGS